MKTETARIIFKHSNITMLETVLTLIEIDLIINVDTQWLHGSRVCDAWTILSEIRRV
jgi:hypothetical protein